MQKNYHHLREQDRIFLDKMLEKGYPKSKIAKILGVHRSTIYRELSRNSLRSQKILKRATPYFSSIAHKKYLARRNKLTKLEQYPELKIYIHDKLRQGWSPWQIEGRLKHENAGQTVITHETIYRYIYSDYDVRNSFYNKLRRKHFWRIKRGARKARVPKELMIDRRPTEIESRIEFGHWECDLMLFKQGIKSNLITLRERKTRTMIAIKNANKSARNTAINLISTLTPMKQFIKSLTFDQGSEFMKYSWIRECLDADIYFCQPASPEQKGGVENGNGVIRVELPRDTNVDILRQKDISHITAEINDRPLKCLDYKTPKELFFEETGFTL